MNNNKKYQEFFKFLSESDTGEDYPYISNELLFPIKLHFKNDDYFTEDFLLSCVVKYNTDYEIFHDYVFFTYFDKKKTKITKNHILDISAHFKDFDSFNDDVVFLYTKKYNETININHNKYINKNIIFLNDFVIRDDYLIKTKQETALEVFDFINICIFGKGTFLFDKDLSTFFKDHYNPVYEWIFVYNPTEKTIIKKNIMDLDILDFNNIVLIYNDKHNLLHIHDEKQLYDLSVNKKTNNIILDIFKNTCPRDHIEIFNFINIEVLNYKVFYNIYENILDREQIKKLISYKGNDLLINAFKIGFCSEELDNTTFNRLQKDNPIAADNYYLQADNKQEINRFTSLYEFMDSFKDFFIESYRYLKKHNLEKDYSLYKVYNEFLKESKYTKNHRIISHNIYSSETHLPDLKKAH